MLVLSGRTLEWTTARYRRRIGRIPGTIAQSLQRNNFLDIASNHKTMISLLALWPCLLALRSMSVDIMQYDDIVLFIASGMGGHLGYIKALIWRENLRDILT